MIISASYKTDIPAFYGNWFMNRLRAGYCSMIQPYNRRTIRISLLPEDVDGWVFWTKNLGPFVKHLPDIRAFDRPFVVQYTINGYPRELESVVVSPDRSIDHMHRLAQMFGPHAGVWRYDPVLITSLTNLDFHVDNFASLARRLAGATNEVVISFANFYRKTTTNLVRLQRSTAMEWSDPDLEIKRRLTAEFASIAKKHGMKLTICAQPDVQAGIAEEARCIDAQRLSQISGHPLPAQIRGNRPHCACYASHDIGEYDTCPHGCVYCYAVRNHPAASERYRRHDPAGEFLFSPAQEKASPSV